MAATIKDIARRTGLGLATISKYINGGGNSIGGIIIDGGRFRWDFEKHTALAEFRKYGKMAFLLRLRTDL